jgi:hypothetical protein
VGEHLLERHEAIALAEREKPRQAFGHFHAGEALLPVLRVAHEDRETDREAGDVRERLTGSNRERGEHRVDVALVAPLELRLLGLGKIFDARDGDALARECRAQLARPHLRLIGLQLEDALARFA